MPPPFTAYAAPLSDSQWSVAVNGILGVCGLAGLLVFGSGVRTLDAPMRRLGTGIALASVALYVAWLEFGPFRPLWLFLPLVSTGLLFCLVARRRAAAEMRRSAAFAQQRRSLSGEDLKVASIAADPHTLLACWNTRAEREINANTRAANVIIESWHGMGRCSGRLTLAFLITWGAAQVLAPYGALPSFDWGRKKIEGFQDFWPAEVLRTPDGCLTSAKFIPLRAIARRPNACLYNKADSEDAGDVAEVMRAWVPYYVFANTEKSLLVATYPNAKDSERRWALVKDCFCWTTRECLNIEQPTPIYRTLEDAQMRRHPVDSSYTYPFKEHFVPAEKNSGKRGFAMPSLPIFANVDGKYFGFVRPEGTTGYYEVGWLAWDGVDGAVECRLRASRQEFETYIAGVRKLMTDWLNAEKKSEAKKDLYIAAQEHVIGTKGPPGGEVGLDTIKVRNEGIPRLDGFLQRPIESELAYQDINERVRKLIELSGRLDLWDGDDVTFIKLSEMP